MSNVGVGCCSQKDIIHIHIKIEDARLSVLDLEILRFVTNQYLMLVYQYNRANNTVI